MTPSERRLEEAHALARRLFAIAEQVGGAFGDAAEGLGLTPVQARALLFLEEAVPMRELAGHLACDASNVTGVADRLTGQGLIERVPGEDRRVRLLQLTDEGADLRARLVKAVGDAPTPADRLTRAERSQLIALLDKMLSD